LLNISFLDYGSCGSYSFLYLSGSVVDPDPHHFGKPDPDPHQSEKLDPDSDPYQSENQDPNPHQSEKVKRQIQVMRIHNTALRYRYFSCWVGCKVS